FHDYLNNEQDIPADDSDRYAVYAGLLSSAYSDFVRSDPLTEKVFKVFRGHQPVSVEVPLTELTQGVVPSAP
ncbi:MAG: nitrogenase-stabilizing/protective protein NifW, partial [Chromatiales bacterium]